MVLLRLKNIVIMMLLAAAVVCVPVYVCAAAETGGGISAQQMTQAQELFRQGTSAIQGGQISQAKDYFDRAVAIDSRLAAQSHFILAAGYMAQRNTETAIKEYKQTVELAPQNIMARINLAQAYMLNKQMDKVVDTYNGIIAIQPQSALPHYNLATIYMQQGWFVEAVEEYGKALKLDEKMLGGTNIYLQLGYAHEQLKHYDKSVAAYNKFIEKHPDNIQALFNLANVYYAMRDMEKAVENYEAAIKIKPDVAEMHGNAGLCYFHQDKYDMAQKSFTTALQLKPNLVEALFGMSKLYKKKGNFAKAYNYALKAQKNGLKVSQKYLDGLKDKMDPIKQNLAK